MAKEGQPETRGEKRLLWNWGGCFGGVIVGALGGPMLFGHAVGNPPVAALIGAVLGGGIGFGLVDVLRMVGLIKAQ